MARPSSVPNMSELEQWLRSGLTPKEASQRYADMGLDISAAYISVIRHRAGWPRVNMDHSELIPWVISLEHRNLYDHRMLATESRKRQGTEISAEYEKLLDAWKMRLIEEGAVIHYQPDTEQGWWHVPRREGIDHDLIRVPSPEDEDEGLRLRH